MALFLLDYVLNSDFVLRVMLEKDLSSAQNGGESFCREDECNK